MNKFVKIGNSIFNTKFIRSIEFNKEIFTINFFDTPYVPYTAFKPNYKSKLSFSKNETGYREIKKIYDDFVNK